MGHIQARIGKNKLCSLFHLYALFISGEKLPAQDLLWKGFKCHISNPTNCIVLIFLVDFSGKLGGKLELGILSWT